MPKTYYDEHDNSYKQLFSHPRMVEDLLRGFISQKWVKELDFNTLEKASGSYVSDDLRDREDDIIWKVRWHHLDEWLYIYLLIEFQSSVDRFMAVRLMVYLGMLYQDLIKSDALSQDGKLPPVLPLVLYNGADRWSAKTEISELIAPFPFGMKKYAPHLEYLVMDEHHDYTNEELQSKLKNLAAILFRLEKSRTKSETQDTLVLLKKWLKGAPASLSLAFRTWFRRVKLPRHLPKVELPEFIDLQEVENMLVTTDNWFEQSREEGRKEGREEGREEGRKEGEATLLICLLEQKFGSLEAQTRANLLKLDTETRLKYAERLLTAKTIKEVIKPA
jgi:predicted transposase/invertase (TIGR01784 family)